MSVPLCLAALGLEFLGGYPDWLFRAVGHPVTWIGRLIGSADRNFNREGWKPATRLVAGLLTLLLLLLVAGGSGALVQFLLGGSWLGFAVAALLGSSLLAQRSLGSHVAAVAGALEAEGLAGGRREVAKIVGRDPLSLDEAGVSRAAIESLAENFSDGVVAPAFWLAVAGLGGGAAYKAVNTADSMIGHKTARHGAFGWAAARFDDLINLPASRLTALLLVCAALLQPGASARGAARAVWRDASRHRSPNAGWPEAAMAGALGLALAGPRIYGGVLVDDGFMGEGGRREANARDIRHGLRLYWTADALLAGLLGLVAVAVLTLHG